MGALRTLTLILMDAELLSAPQVLAIGDGGAEYLPQPSPMGLILATKCVAQHTRAYRQPGTKSLLHGGCNLSLPLLLQPSRMKEARSCMSHTHPRQNLPIKPALCKCAAVFGAVAFGDPTTPTGGAAGAAAALSHLLFRLAFGRGAGEDAAGAQQRAGGLPAADVRHQRGASAGNRGRDTVGPGVGTGGARPPLSPKGDGGEGALPPMPTAQMSGERKGYAMGH